MLIVSQIHPRQAFEPSCPSGGSFYACQSGTNFVGCCAAEACEDGCSDGNLEPASFDPSYYGEFHDQECPTGSRWYTCAATQPAFMGCCKTNPCSNNGCPTGDLTAGFLSSNPKQAADFLPSGAAAVSSSSSSSSTPTSTSSTVTTSSSQTSSSTTSAQSSSAASADSQTAATASLSPSPIAQGHKSPGTVGGISAGAVAGALILLGLLVFWMRRRTHRSREHMSHMRAASWGSGKEAVVVESVGKDSEWKPAVTVDTRHPGASLTAYELMSPSPLTSSSFPSPQSPTSELDGQAMQRPIPISPHLTQGSYSPPPPSYSPQFLSPNPQDGPWRY